MLTLRTRATLFRVITPLLSPLAARSGDYLAWFPAGRCSVVRKTPRGWFGVRGRRESNHAELLRLQSDGAVESVHECANSLRPYDVADASARAAMQPAGRNGARE